MNTDVYLYIYIFFYTYIHIHTYYTKLVPPFFSSKDNIGKWSLAYGESSHAITDFRFLFCPDNSDKHAVHPIGHWSELAILNIWITHVCIERLRVRYITDSDYDNGSILWMISIPWYYQTVNLCSSVAHGDSPCVYCISCYVYVHVSFFPAVGLQLRVTIDVDIILRCSSSAHYSLPGRSVLCSGLSPRIQRHRWDMLSVRSGATLLIQIFDTATGLIANMFFADKLR